MPKSNVVHGDDLLYRFFLDLSVSQPDQFAALLQRLLESMSVWLPVEVYEVVPGLVEVEVAVPRSRPAVW